MINKINLQSNALIPAQGNTWAILDDFQKVAVQFWAIKTDGAIIGIGLYGGDFVALETLPGFAGYR